MKNKYLKVDQSILGDCYSSDEVWENLRIMTDEFGSRFGGTEGEKRAMEFLKEKLENYGLHSVWVEPIEYLGWRRGVPTFEILSPIKREIQCISLPFSPPGIVEASLIDMGEGHPESFAEREDEIAGNIVLTNSVVSFSDVNRRIHRNEKLGRSILAGAAGFIFVNHYPGYGPPTGGIGHNGKASLVPGIGLSMEDGAFLSRLIEKHGKIQVRLETRDYVEPMTSWNVFGEFEGRSEDIVMMGCHYDGHDISQGAQDPASGTAALLECARLISTYADKMECGIRFSFWGIEEIGLLGSKAYVKQHQDELDKIRFYFNMDSAGAIADKGVVLNEWPALTPLFENWAKEMALPFEVGQSINAHSDHFPFLKEGVPTAGMEQVKRNLSGRGYGHTAYDTLDKVNIRDLREASTLAARLAVRIGDVNSSDWPVSRRSRSEIDALFDNPQYEEETKFREAIAAHYDTT